MCVVFVILCINPQKVSFICGVTSVSWLTLRTSFLQRQRIFRDMTTSSFKRPCFPRFIVAKPGVMDDVVWGAEGLVVNSFAGFSKSMFWLMLIKPQGVAQRANLSTSTVTEKRVDRHLGTLPCCLETQTFPQLCNKCPPVWVSYMRTSQFLCQVTRAHILFSFLMQRPPAQIFVQVNFPDSSQTCFVQSATCFADLILRLFWCRYLAFSVFLFLFALPYFPFDALAFISVAVARLSKSWWLVINSNAACPVWLMKVNIPMTPPGTNLFTGAWRLERIN